MESLFAESNRWAAVYGGEFADIVDNELEITLPLDPRVSIGDILDKLDEGYNALWLDRECAIVESRWGVLPVDNRNVRYHVNVSLMSGRCHPFYICQVLGTRERGTPLPALEYLIDRITNDDQVDNFCMIPMYGDDNDETKTLDVSPRCFANILQTSRRLHDARDCSVMLFDVSLTAEQTALLLTHDTGPICIDLYHCRFHGPTLLQLGSREQTRVVGRGSFLRIIFAKEEIDSTSHDDLTALLSNPHLRCFDPFSGRSSRPADNVSYELVKKLVDVLAANKISRLECLRLYASGTEIKWEKEEQPSMWINFWKAIEIHPSLKEIRLREHPRLSRQSWWQPIAAAVKVNPRLVHVVVEDDSNGSYSEDGSDSDNASDRIWKILLAKHVEPLLERNLYRPKIAALCRTDPSKAAALLVQAIVAVRDKSASAEIHQMLVEQLVPFDVGGVGRVLGKKRPLADTVVVVPNDALATKTEPRVADGIAASTSDNNESKL